MIWNSLVLMPPTKGFTACRTLQVPEAWMSLIAYTGGHIDSCMGLLAVLEGKKLTGSWETCQQV